MEVRNPILYYFFEWLYKKKASLFLTRVFHENDKGMLHFPTYKKIQSYFLRLAYLSQ